MSYELPGDSSSETVFLTPTIKTKKTLWALHYNSILLSLDLNFSLTLS